MARKTVHGQQNCCLDSFRQVAITNDTQNKTYRSDESI